MAGGAARKTTAGAGLLLLAAAALLSARSGAPALGRGELAPAPGARAGEAAFEVAQATRRVEVRGRTLRRRIRSLTRAVEREEDALKKSGVHVKLSQLQDFKLDVGDLKSAFARVSAEVKLPAAEASAPDGKDGGRLPAAVREKQKKMLDKALALADSAIKDDSMAAAKRVAWQKDEAAYHQALVKAAKSNSDIKGAEAKKESIDAIATLLQKEKALLKAREHREALQRLAKSRHDKLVALDEALQHKLDSTIESALKDAKRALARKNTQNSSKPIKAVVMQWAAAAKAAKRGDTGVVHAFCSAQADSKDCVSALKRHAASKKPCSPLNPGYFQCLGIKDTGGTL